MTSMMYLGSFLTANPFIQQSKHLFKQFINKVHAYLGVPVLIQEFDTV